jgi:hypothetical protein
LLCFLIFTFGLFAGLFGLYQKNIRTKVYNNKFLTRAFLHSYQDNYKVKTILKKLTPQDPITDKKKIRLGRDNDGGYVMLDNFENTQAVYGFGIANDFSWEEGILRRIGNVYVFMYDHTIDPPNVKDEHLKWRKIGICGKNSRGQDLKTLEELLKEDGNFGKENIVLKMDVEGAEWDVFSTISEEVMNKFSQIVVEFHDMCNLNKDHYNKMLNALNKINATHQVIHIHGNNYGNYLVIGGIPMPETLEITYLRRKDWRFKENAQVYPTKLDQPNNPKIPEYMLAFVNNELMQ